MEDDRMGLRPHYLMDLVAGSAAVVTIAIYWFATRSAQPTTRKWFRLLLLFGFLVVAAGVALAPIRVSIHFPNTLVQWVRCVAIFVAVWVLYSIPIVAGLYWTGSHRPGRRQALKTAAALAIATPPVMAAAAFLRREELTFREVDISIPGLPRDLNGLRLVQLSDIHLSPFVTEGLLARSVAMANETKAHIALVTGDLVSRIGDPLDTCLKHLGRLRADAGIIGCLGNHEVYIDGEDYVTVEGAKLGIRFLRGQSQPLHFGDAVLNMAGVDYQRRGRPYLRGAERLLLPGATNLLLSHNPDVFRVSAAQGFDLTISGHTHGGQVNFEILEQNVNIARFFTPYIYGRYVRDGKSLFVTRGIGTVGAPARLGAPPEVALIRLCAS
jgi:predicted MPP superfamily phosphohydrolase